MRRGNQVILDGQVSLKRVYWVQDRLALEVAVATDLAVFGGVHPVVVTAERLVFETLAFILVARAHSEELTAAVLGWLFSAEERSHVVAEEITFHVRPVVREQAGKVLRVLESTYRSRGRLPESVAVNGWQVRLSEVLADGMVLRTA